MLSNRAKAKNIASFNGGVTLGASATANKIEVKNGQVRLGRAVNVAENIDITNGDIKLKSLSKVGGNNPVSQWQNHLSASAS